jgi:hypothetical protein
MTGPAIFVVKMKYEGLYCLRGDYTAHEVGLLITSRNQQLCPWYFVRYPDAS